MYLITAICESRFTAVSAMARQSLPAHLQGRFTRGVEFLPGWFHRNLYSARAQVAFMDTLAAEVAAGGGPTVRMVAGWGAPVGAKLPCEVGATGRYDWIQRRTVDAESLKYAALAKEAVEELRRMFRTARTRAA